MNKVYYIVIITITTVILFSCNNQKKENKESTSNETDIVGVWESKGHYDGESGETLSIILKLKNGKAYYDNSYTGTYKLVNDTIYFDYTLNEDPDVGVQKMWFKLQSDSTLISEHNSTFIKISDDMYKYEAKVQEESEKEQERLTAERNELKQKSDTLKPTMYEVVQMLTGRIFIGKKNNYYFTFDFTYTVLDEQDNAMFWCKYEEFELNSNYGSTPMEILKQSANSATFLKSEKLMVTVMKNDLHNNMIVVKRNRAYDDMPRFDFWITEIERDSEGNLEQARIDAQALGVRLNGIRK